MLNILTKKTQRAAPTIPDGTLVYAVGDIHGRADCLQRVFSRIDQDKAQRTFERCVEVYLGDYIDRGSASKQVIDLLMARRAAGEVVTLKGNHETFMLDALRDANAAAPWRELGGLETMTSYGPKVRLPLTPESLAEVQIEWAASVPQAHVDFLNTLPLSFQLGDYFFCHAGVRPSIPLEEQVEADLLWIRDEFLSSPTWHGARIVHGHTPVADGEILPNRINVDGGAYMTNRLACVRLQGAEAELL